MSEARLENKMEFPPERIKGFLLYQYTIDQTMAYYVPSIELYGNCHLIESVIYVYIMIILKMNNKMISKLNISLVNKLMLVNSWCRCNI